SCEVFQDLRDQSVCFSTGGAVADGYKLDLVAANDRRKGGHGTSDIVPRLEGIYGVSIEQLSGSVDNRDLDTGTNAGIETEGGLHPSGSREQEGLHVLHEHIDRLYFRPLPGLRQHFRYQA